MARCHVGVQKADRINKDPAELPADNWKAINPSSSKQLLEEVGSGGQRSTWSVKPKKGFKTIWLLFFNIKNVSVHSFIRLGKSLNL